MDLPHLHILNEDGLWINVDLQIFNVNTCRYMCILCVVTMQINVHFWINAKEMLIATPKMWLQCGSTTSPPLDGCFVEQCGIQHFKCEYLNIC